MPRNTQPRPAQLRHSRAETRDARRRVIAKRSRILRNLNHVDRTVRRVDRAGVLVSNGRWRAWDEIENGLCDYASDVDGQAGPRFFVPTRVLIERRAELISSGDWLGRLFAQLPHELAIFTHGCSRHCDYCMRKRWRNAKIDGWRAHMRREETAEIRAGVNAWLDERDKDVEL